MARRPAATDGLLALIFGAAMQIEVSFVDAPTADLFVARAALLVLAVALAFRRLAPVLCMAVGIVVTIVLERLDQNVDENLVATFFATLILAYSVGAHAEGRRLCGGHRRAGRRLPRRDAARSASGRGRATCCSWPRSSSPARCCSAGWCARGSSSTRRCRRRPRRSSRIAAARAARRRSPASASGSRRELHHVVSESARRDGRPGGHGGGALSRAARRRRDGVRGGRGRPAARRSARSAACSASCAARTRSSRWRPSRRSPTSRTSSPGCTRPVWRSSSTSRASARRCPAGVDLHRLPVGPGGARRRAGGAGSRRAAVRVRYAATARARGHRRRRVAPAATAAARHARRVALYGGDLGPGASGAPATRCARRLPLEPVA